MNKKTKTKARKLVRCCISRIDKNGWMAGGLYDSYGLPSDKTRYCAVGLISACAFDDGTVYPASVVSGRTLLRDATEDQKVVVQATIEALFDELPASFRKKHELRDDMDINEKENAIVEFNDEFLNGEPRTHSGGVRKLFHAAEERLAA